MSSTVCVFEGEDAAPEAMRPTVALLEALDNDVSYETPDVEPYLDDLERGVVPDELADRIEAADTVLFGSASDVFSPIIRYLRNEYGGGLPANVRPVWYMEGTRSPLADPEGIDYVIVRENLEGLYARAGGDLSDLLASDLVYDGEIRADPDEEGAFDLRTVTARNVRWLAEFACELAADRDSRLTCSTKSNVLGRTDGLFQRIVEETAAEYDLDYEHLHADALGQELVASPKRFGVTITPNLFGDVLSDVGAGTVGGLGIAPSGCYGDDRAYFEPVHGTAPDIAGEASINPTATILSAAMMLEYLGYEGDAARLRSAVEAVYAAGEPLTPDQGGSASTDEMVAAIEENL